MTDIYLNCKGTLPKCGKIKKTGGPNKEERLKKVVEEFLEKCYELESKIFQSIEELKNQSLNLLESLKIKDFEHYYDMLIKHIDLVDRRLLKGETIPHNEKVFSLFEPHTKWINKGKFIPPIELGHKLLITSDQYDLIIDYKVMNETADSKETLPLADRLLNRYGEDSIGSISFDKGFSDKEDRELLELYIPEVIMSKKGRLSQADKEREYNGPQKLDHMLNYRCGLNIIKGVRSERKEKTAFSSA